MASRTFNILAIHEDARATSGQIIGDYAAALAYARELVASRPSRPKAIAVHVHDTARGLTRQFWVSDLGDLLLAEPEQSGSEGRALLARMRALGWRYGATGGGSDALFFGYPTDCEWMLTDTATDRAPEAEVGNFLMGLYDRHGEQVLFIEVGSLRDAVAIADPQRFMDGDGARLAEPPFR